ncbi:MAG: hypothetical protein GWN00_19965 [Aliifodinibius sp.]|nr:hypothetical protein [Fodinibius sp.]NIY26998.1 hypothetical protein [Fodinibius sp.]
MMGPKSSKFHKVDTPPGVTDLFSLIAFLSDPKQVESQLKRLLDYIELANESVENLGKVEDIERLLQDAENKHKQASQVLAEAEVDAQKVRGAANAYQQEIYLEVKSSTDDLRRKAEEERESAHVLMNEATQMRENAEKDLAEAHALAEQLAARQERLEQREAEVARKEDVLSQL